MFDNYSGQVIVAEQSIMMDFCLIPQLVVMYRVFFVVIFICWVTKLYILVHKGHGVDNVPPIQILHSHLSTSFSFTPATEMGSNAAHDVQSVVMDQDYFMDTSSVVFLVCLFNQDSNNLDLMTCISFHPG